MKRIEYPHSGKIFLRDFFIMFSGGVLSFIAVGIGSTIHYQLLTLLGALMFGLFVLGGLITIMWKIKHKKCPQCQASMKSHPDYVTSTWIATCQYCNVEWDLGIGCDPTS